MIHINRCVSSALIREDQEEDGIQMSVLCEIFFAVHQHCFFKALRLFLLFKFLYICHYQVQCGSTWNIIYYYIMYYYYVLCINVLLCIIIIMYYYCVVFINLML